MIGQCKEEDEENNGYRRTDRHANMQHTDPDSTLYWAG